MNASDSDDREFIQTAAVGSGIPIDAQMTG